MGIACIVSVFLLVSERIVGVFVKTPVMLRIVETLVMLGTLEEHNHHLPDIETHPPSYDHDLPSPDTGPENKKPKTSQSQKANYKIPKKQQCRF